MISAEKVREIQQYDFGIVVNIQKKFSKPS